VFALPDVAAEDQAGGIGFHRPQAVGTPLAQERPWPLTMRACWDP
jgi:hypothetical protein